MATEQWLIDAEPIKKFIVDGLNNPDLKKAFGHDAIEILTEIEYAPTVDAAPVVHGRWVEWWPPKHMILTGEEMLYRCSACDAKYSDTEGYKYCPNCGAKMDGDGK